jgi:retinoblastoma-associated protein
VLSLYYHSLQAVLSVETKRLGSNVHTQLLSNPTFHKSLLAVGCQCVIFASSLSNGTDLQFPAVLKIMEIDPIDFLRIAECFVRALCASTVSSSTSVLAIPFELPCAIKNHLQECEELVLEKFMWESPVPSSAVRYNCIQDAIQALQHYSSDLINGILWPPLCLIDGASGKILRERNRLDILSKIPSRSLQHHYNTVSFIFRKLVTLSARRILDFSELLHLDQYVTEQIWLTWKQLLVDHIALLYDRHIDQLIICTIYGVCKIARIEPELTFARIFEAYYDLNPGRERLNEHIIRHILLGPDGQQGNVINLYNQVFVPLAKQQLWKFKYYAREKQSQASDSNLDEEVRLPFESSVYEAKCSFLPVRGLVNVAPRSRVDKTNVYVTSFSDPKSGDVNEDPRPVGPRVLYSFGDSSCYVSFRHSKKNICIRLSTI